jgi:hypothetical protein
MAICHRQLGMVIGLLCVCRAVSLTLDNYETHKDFRQSYLQQFTHDLPRWISLFGGKEREWFVAALRNNWWVDAFSIALLFPFNRWPRKPQCPTRPSHNVQKRHTHNTLYEGVKPVKLLGWLDPYLRSSL